MSKDVEDKRQEESSQGTTETGANGEAAGLVPPAGLSRAQWQRKLASDWSTTVIATLIHT